MWDPASQPATNPRPFLKKMLQPPHPSDELLDATLANLKILGMLRRNDKVSVRKGQMSIDRSASGSGILQQSFWRWLHRDSRDVTLLHIKNTVANTVRLVRSLCAGAIQLELREWILARLVAEIEAAANGLQNLGATYLPDSSTVALLDVLAERLRANGNELSRFMGDSQPPSQPQPQPAAVAPADAAPPILEASLQQPAPRQAKGGAEQPKQGDKGSK